MHRTILQGVVGSTAYGLATESSDTDRLGIYLRPTAEVLSVTYGGHVHDSHVTHTPYDSQSHELGKYIRLALAANPTLLELLWLDSYEVQEIQFEPFLKNRTKFLSNRVRATYGGYAMQQARRLRERGGTFDPDLAKRTEKHGRHIARLLIQGKELISTGSLTVCLTSEQREHVFAMGKLATSNYNTFHDVFKLELEDLDHTVSVLPDEPDSTFIDKLFLDIRKNYWDWA